jgi:hypothetical protein
VSKVTELGQTQFTATQTITVELIETEETPAVVIFGGQARQPSYTPDDLPMWPPQSRECSQGCHLAGIDQAGASTGTTARLRLFDVSQSGSSRAPVRVRRSISNLHLLATGGGHCPTTSPNTLRSL